MIATNESNMIDSSNAYVSYTLPLTLLSPAIAMQLQSWTNAATNADIMVAISYSHSYCSLSC
jgi:hypothetical protein